MYVEVKSLHPQLQAILRSIPYAKREISVEAAETVSPIVGGGSGRRGFLILIDLTTWRTERRNGSWGGANPWAKDNPVDLDTNRYPLPANGAVVHGTVGHSTYASLTVHPSQLAQFLPKPAEVELTLAQRRGLYAHRALTGGQGRRDYLSRHRVGPEIIDSLVQLGMLKQNRAGSTSITTDGRNAIGDENLY